MLSGCRKASVLRLVNVGKGKRMKAEFRRKEPETNASECVVEKMIVLPEQEYQHFASHLMKDYDFIRENIDLMYEQDDVWHCLLVAGAESREGVLVESEGASYARYSAVLPDASSFMHPQYQTLKNLQEKLEDAVEFIVREGTEETRNGGWIAHHEEWQKKFDLDSKWTDIVSDMLEEREEVQEINHLGEDFEVDFYTQYCPNVVEKVETSNQNMSL